MLLKAGSDPNVKDKVFESTPLHHLVIRAVFENPVPDEITQMILSLLKHGAKVDLENKSGMTPINLIKSMNSEYYKFLMGQVEVLGGKRKTKKIKKKSKKFKKFKKLKKTKKLRRKSKKK